MFITGGRAGQVSFFVMLAVLIIQVFKKQRLKSLIAIIIFIPIIFTLAYQTSDLFQKRVNTAVVEISNYSDSKITSVGLRINFAINSWELIKKNPILGVGTGDFPMEYKKINLINSPEAPNTTNPHNMYTLVTTKLGLIGLISMLSIIFYQIKFSLNCKDKFRKDTGYLLPIIFLVLMLSDSYLLGHFTSLMYVFFSAFLYKNFEEV